MLKSGGKRALAWGFGGVLARGVIVLFVPTGEWRNGRRAGFRCQCPSGRGGSSPPSPTAKILGSVKASEDFLFLGLGFGVGLGLKQRQMLS